jgi:hypothetical protein
VKCKCKFEVERDLFKSTRGHAQVVEVSGSIRKEYGPQEEGWQRLYMKGAGTHASVQSS